MKKEKIKTLYGSDWESLFAYFIESRWEKGEIITDVVLSKEASIPIRIYKDKKKYACKTVDFYESNFGTHTLKVDKRYKGDKIIFKGYRT